MKSWWLSLERGEAKLESRETAKPEPRAGEMRVRVRAASLNRGEFIYAHGAAGHQQARPSGQESAGEVDAVGAGVVGWKPGDRVMGRVRGGGFAEYTVMDAREAIPVPPALSWVDAAAVPIVMMVTYDMLWEQGELRLGESLLITGVSSGVGVACLQMGKLLGARVIGTSGSRAKLERLAALGLDVPLVTRKPDFETAVKEATGGKGANLAVNNVGGTMFAECVKSLAYRGRLATVGYLDRTFKAEIDIDALHSQRLRLFGVSNRFRTADERAAMVTGFIDHIVPALADGALRPLVDRTFGFDDLPAAKAYMDSDAQVGKIVVTL
jgi:NADPH:quinone reductase-like Zn-dependent oxidoreductase